MNCKLVSFRFCCLNSSNDIISYPATLAERQLRKTHKVDQNEAFYYKDVSHSYCNPIQLKIYTVVVASSSRPKSTILHGPNICDTSFSAKSVVPLQNLSHSTFPTIQCSVYSHNKCKAIVVQSTLFGRGNLSGSIANFVLLMVWTRTASSLLQITMDSHVGSNLTCEIVTFTSY